MSKSVTITVRVDPETSNRLDTLAATTRRSKSFLASLAISGYAEREMAIMEGIEAGIADRETGRVLPHEEVMDNIDHIIDQWDQTKS